MHQKRSFKTCFTLFLGCALLFALSVAAQKPAPQTTLQKKQAQQKPPAPHFGHWGPSGYHLVKEIPIPGNHSWDKLAFDPVRRHLFVTHGVEVVVVNPDTGKIIGRIPNTLGVHGIALALDLNRGFITNGQTNSVTIFDLRTLKIVGTSPAANGPDDVAYDPFTKRIFTMNAASSTITAINAVNGRFIGDVFVGGQPSAAVSDEKGHIYVSLENTSEALEIDAKKFQILNRWPMSPCEAARALAMDTEHGLFFAGCRNRRMAVIEADSGTVLAALPAGFGAGAARFDPAIHYAYSSNVDGTLTIVYEDGENRFNVVENVETEPGAQTMALDPKRHEVFLVTARSQPAPPHAPPGTRPTLIPGTVHVLVLQRD